MQEYLLGKLLLGEYIFLCYVWCKPTEEFTEMVVSFEQPFLDAAVPQKVQVLLTNAHS